MVVFLWRVAHTAGNTFDEYRSSPYKQGGVLLLIPMETHADVVIDVLEICVIYIYIHTVHTVYVYIYIAACTIQVPDLRMDTR